MGKSRSCKSEGKFVSLHAMSTPTRIDPNAYETLRMARIAENQARMAALGVQKHAGDLKAFFKVTKSPRKDKYSAQKVVLQYTPLRRSERLKHRTPTTPNTEIRRSKRFAKQNPQSPSSDAKKGGLFESDDEKTPKSTRNLARNSYKDNGERRPANAPLPNCSVVDLELSPVLMAQRCHSKSRGSVYDPILGICCHFCRQKKLCGEENCRRCGDRDVTKPCLGKTDCSICHSSTGVFCRACLKIRYGEEIEEVRENKNWMCPHCSEEQGINPYWICNSSICLKKRKIPPTGIAIYTAREMGYKSVADYLVDVLKKQGFSGKQEAA
eukprot:Gb_21180 [translate_table: standard]